MSSTDPHSPRAGLRDRLRRRIWLVLPGAAAVAVVIAWLWPTPDSTACTRDDVAATWNAEVKREVATAIAATEEPNAQQTAALVVAAIDDYAARWRVARAEACALPYQSKDAAQRLEKTMTCLRARRGELEALVGNLRDADATSARSATAEVARLVPPARCR